MPTVIRYAAMIVATALLAASAPLLADEPNVKKPAPTESDLIQAKEQALQWIRDYRKKQVLFHDNDIARLQQRLQSDSPKAVAQWWSKTAEMREALDSPQWQVTREWFKEFLKVQAIYSDEEIEKLRQETKDAVEAESPEDFKAMLARVATMRTNLIKGAANSKALREQQLSVLQAYRQQEATRRVQAAHTAAKVDTFAQPVQVRPPRSAPAPSIDSIDAARWSIIRGFWRY